MGPGLRDVGDLKTQEALPGSQSRKQGRYTRPSKATERTREKTGRMMGAGWQKGLKAEER